MSGAAQAALLDRGGGLIYDTTRDITWLADMNYAKTSGYDADGLMTWTAANDWANNLVYGGFSDWRLPTLNPSDTSCSYNVNPGGGFPQQYYGYECTGGELSGLFVTDLGNKANESVLTTTGDTAQQIANLGLFSNVQSSAYWSGTEYAPNPSNAWNFSTNEGDQNNDDMSNALNLLALRDTLSDRGYEPGRHARCNWRFATTSSALTSRACSRCSLRGCAPVEAKALWLAEKLIFHGCMNDEGRPAAGGPAARAQDAVSYAAGQGPADRQPEQPVLRQYLSGRARPVRQARAEVPLVPALLRRLRVGGRIRHAVGELEGAHRELPGRTAPAATEPVSPAVPAGERWRGLPGLHRATVSSACAQAQYRHWQREFAGGVELIQVGAFVELLQWPPRDACVFGQHNGAGRHAVTEFRATSQDR